MQKTRRVARVVVKKGLYEPDDQVAYWRRQPYIARLAALEEIRQEYHQWISDAQPGFQRVYRLVKR